MVEWIVRFLLHFFLSIRVFSHNGVTDSRAKIPLLAFIVMKHTISLNSTFNAPSCTTKGFKNRNSINDWLALLAPACAPEYSSALSEFGSFPVILHVDLCVRLRNQSIAQEADRKVSTAMTAFHVNTVNKSTRTVTCHCTRRKIHLLPF